MRTRAYIQGPYRPPTSAGQIGRLVRETVWAIGSLSAVAYVLYALSLR